MSNLHIVGSMPITQTLRGEWSLIQWNPDIATEELFNIGVALNVDGQLQFKMLDYYERLTCLFDQDAIQHLKDVMELSEHALKHHCYDFSDQIKWVNKGTTKGRNEEEILERLYNRVVTLGKHCNKQINRTDFKTVQNEAFVKRMTKRLRDQFVNNTQMLNIIKSGQDQFINFNNDQLYVPLQGNQSFGGIVSVVTKNIDRINANYLTNANDLKTASLLHNKQPKLFILSPSDDELNKLDSDVAEKIDYLIDSLNRKQEQQGLQIESETDEDILKDKVEYWALNAA